MASYKRHDIQLVDEETNIIYTIALSEKDAHKVKTDLQYASTLLAEARECATVLTNNETVKCANMSKCDSKETKTSNNEDTYIWSKSETLLLLHLYKENEAMFTSGKMKQHLCWEEIAKKMTEKDHNISAKKCCTKFQTLKRTYKQIKDHNNKSGNERKTWEYFEAMDELCGSKPWIEATAVAGSHINKIDETDDEPSIKKRRSNKETKNSPGTSRQMIFEYRQHRAERRDLQHKEKMDLLRDIKNLLQNAMEKE